MDNILGEIYLASEYDQFKLISGNRDIRYNKKLEESILKDGILRPIAVNSNMEILDGQHRYTIAKNHNLPLPYFVTVSRVIDDIIDLNNAAHKWKVIDYVHKYKEEGLHDYLLLEDMILNNKNIAIADLVSAAQGYLKKNYTAMNKVKNGSFSYKNYEEFSIYVDLFKEFIYKTRIKPNTGVFMAFFSVVTIKKIDFYYFIERVNLKDVRNKILGIRDSAKLTKIFVEAYNYNLKENSQKYIEYGLKKDRSIIIMEERNNKLMH